MKFVHIADMHFDSPLTNLTDKGNLGEQRRLEQRKVFKKVIEYITILFHLFTTKSKVLYLHIIFRISKEKKNQNIHHSIFLANNNPYPN